MPQTNRSSVLWNRRRFVIVAGAAASLSLFAPPASGETEDVDAAVREFFGDRKVQEGRVSLKLPPIAENGNSVQLSVSVDSPMTGKDHVRQIAIFSPRNPIPLIGRFKLGPHSGRAAVSTRVRLAGTQSLLAVAEMSDGSLWTGRGSTYVTLAACIIG